MKAIYRPLFLLLVPYAVFLGVWFWAGLQLPSRVASHFDIGGRPNGWMSREGAQTFILIFGSGVPLLIPLMFYLTRFLPAGLVNIPNRQYWLAPDRRRHTSDLLVRMSLWLACLVSGLMTATHYTTVLANRQSPPGLPMHVFWMEIGLFLAGTIIWTVFVMRRFRNPS